MITLVQLEKWLAAPSEDEHLEFKEAKNRFDFEKLVGYCVALANEGGGHMVLGVSDKPPRKVVGTAAFDIPETTVGGIYERLHFRVTWTELNHTDGRVLVFSVPSRPVGQPIEYKSRYQHCCLRYVNNEITNNESIRERFKIDKRNAAQATRLINEATPCRS